MGWVMHWVSVYSVCTGRPYWYTVPDLRTSILKSSSEFQIHIQWQNATREFKDMKVDIESESKVSIPVCEDRVGG
eukprot:COSAG02_NODE_406_length_22916_cov_35.137529_3_plen_75_part_00